MPAWNCSSVTDSYGQVTKFDYGTPGQVKMIAPVNAEGIAATTTLSLYADSLQTCYRPAGPEDQLRLQPRPGVNPRSCSAR